MPKEFPSNDEFELPDSNFELNELDDLIGEFCNQLTNQQEEIYQYLENHKPVTDKEANTSNSIALNEFYNEFLVIYNQIMGNINSSKDLKKDQRDILIAYVNKVSSDLLFEVKRYDYMCSIVKN